MRHPWKTGRGTGKVREVSEESVKINSRCPYFLIVILGFAIYANSIGGKFIWDDYDLVRDNLYIRDWSNLGKIFTRDMGAGAWKEYRFYRPLTIFTYLLDYSLWRLSPKGYHLCNVLLHILVALALYFLIDNIYSDRIPGFFVAITNYVRLILVPVDLHMEYGKGLFAWTEPKAIMGIVILLGALAYSFKTDRNLIRG